jgi:hypothetical protein
VQPGERTVRPATRAFSGPDYERSRPGPGTKPPAPATTERCNAPPPPDRAMELPKRGPSGSLRRTSRAAVCSSWRGREAAPLIGTV